VLGPTDDITRFEYMQKTNKESGPALIGIELKNKEDYENILSNLAKYNFQYTELNKNDTLFGYVV
jgi:threonine dehydratase